MAPSTQFLEVLSIIRDLIKLIQVWLPNRRKSIEILREKADELENITKNSNIAKVVGSSLGVTGGILAGAGLLATAFTAGTALPLIGIGMTAAVGSGITTAGAEIGKIIDSKIQINKSKKVMERDSSEQEGITELIKKLHDMHKIHEKEFEEYESGVDVEQLKEMIDGANSAQTACTTLPESESQERLAVSQLTRVAYGPVLTLIFRSAGLSVEQAGLHFTLSSFQFAASMTSAAGKGVEASATATAKTAARGVALVTTPVFLAIDIYQLVHTAIDINNGSKSELAKLLREIADALDKELRDYERLLCELEIYCRPSHSY